SLSRFHSLATAPPSLCTLSLPDALPISDRRAAASDRTAQGKAPGRDLPRRHQRPRPHGAYERLRRGVVGRSAGALECKKIKALRSEEHTSELQSREKLVCRLLLEKKKKT